MTGQEKAIRDIFTSDVILMDKEIEMTYGIDDSYFDKMEDIYSRVENGEVVLKKEDVDMLEKKFNDFYFEYAYIQFKRGLELGLAFRDIH